MRFLHNQDASWEKNFKCKDVLKVGDEVKVKIAKINKEDQKISLNSKALQESPIDKFATTHKVNQLVKGKIRDIKDFGIFVQLDDGIDALIRDEDLSPLVKEELSVGSDIEAAIASIDTRRDRIRLSIKKLDYIKNQELMNEINDNESHSLGDLIKDQLQ